jgi:hypothetical protein
MKMVGKIPRFSGPVFHIFDHFCIIQEIRLTVRKWDRVLWEPVGLPYRSFLYWAEKSGNFLDLFGIFPAQPTKQSKHYSTRLGPLPFFF